MDTPSSNTVSRCYRRRYCYARCHAMPNCICKQDHLRQLLPSFLVDPSFRYWFFASQLAQPLRSGPVEASLFILTT